MKLITVAIVLNVKAMHMRAKDTHSEINEPNISLVHSLMDNIDVE